MCLLHLAGAANAGVAQVVDVNEPPIFLCNNTSCDFRIYENAPIGTAVTPSPIPAVGADVGDTLQFVITRNDANSFSLSSDGSLYSAVVFSYFDHGRPNHL